MKRQVKFHPIILSVVLTVFWGFSTGIGEAADKVTLAFDWLTYGKMAPFYLGDTQGFYKAENLEVKMVRGFGSIDTAKRVGAKQIEFGMSTLTDTIEIRTRGSKVKTVWIYFHDTPGVVLFLKGKGINKPKDLEGRTMGGPIATDSWVLFPLFAKAQGIDLAKVKHVNMRPADVYGALAGGVVDSIHSWVTVIPAVTKIIGQKGMSEKDLGTFKYVKGGVSLYSQDVVAHEDTIKNNPGLVKRMVRAITRSKVSAIENPEAALEAFWKAKPTLKATSEKANRAELKVSMELFKDKYVDKHGQGYPVREKVVSTHAAFVSAKNLKKEPVDNIYTDEFVKGLSRKDKFPKSWGKFKN
jgi:NitT/TauT family transport system substrate-binding protein